MYAGEEIILVVPYCLAGKCLFRYCLSSFPPEMSSQLFSSERLEMEKAQPETESLAQITLNHTHMPRPSHLNVNTGAEQVSDKST